ncbi:MAG: FHA domain-containing protein [Gemmataceae bacterium]
MVKCPFCHYDNEDGALFCERCSSDLSGVAASEPPPPPAPLAMPDPVPMAFADPLPLAEPLAFADPIPMAEPEPVPPAPAMELKPPPPPPPIPIPAPAMGGALPAGAQPRLQVLRGQKRNVEYPIYEGLNYIGRADEKPVDIDLEEQEPPDRIWCSRQHAVITFEGGVVSLEDLNSANGTYVNRVRVYPGQAKPLAVNDIVQIGNVQMKLVV